MVHIDATGNQTYAHLIISLASNQNYNLITLMSTRNLS